MSRWTEADIPDQTGRTVLVTGANSGLGLRTAQVLAAKGAHVLMGCRSAERGEAARRKVERIGRGRSNSTSPTSASVRAAAEKVETLDVLINNAGIMAVPYGQTADGFERQFGTNHLGHAALTWLLLPALRQRPGARVVTVASLAHQYGRMDFDDPNWERRSYTLRGSYGQSKLANILFARELERRSSDVDVHRRAPRPDRHRPDQQHGQRARVAAPADRRPDQPPVLPVRRDGRAAAALRGDVTRGTRRRVLRPRRFQRHARPPRRRADDRRGP